VLHDARVAFPCAVVDPALPGFATVGGCATRRGVTFDAVVVGGGPGGSTVAWRLARAGARVLVLDAARFPRVKLCAGWVTPAVLRDLELAPASYPHTIQSFETVSIAVDGKEHETRFGRVASHGIVRAEFDTFLLRRAAAAGATVRESARVRRAVRVRDGVRVETDDDAVTVPLVVGAGGHHCPVARAFGEISDEEDVVVTQESETRVDAARLRELTPRYGCPELFAEPDFHGYGWYFTKGDYLNVGVGALGGMPIGKRLERLRAELRDSGRLPDGLALTPFRGHAYAVRRIRPRRIYGDGFLLVGDAAGLARDFSGEGIGPAVRSACLATEAVLGGDPGRYAARVADTFGPPPWSVLGALRGLLPASTVEAVARLACVQPWARRRFVLEGAFGMG
jgi:geranylgeranyl reductase family protein